LKNKGEEKMRIRRLGWWELIIFLTVTAGIVIFIFVTTDNMTWRALAFPLGIFVALLGVYGIPRLVSKIKKTIHDRKMRKKAEMKKLQEKSPQVQV